MQISDLIRRFKGTRERQEKAVFSTLCIAENRLQTIFDRSSSGITLKQFMLLTMVRQSEERLTFTQLGDLLGCSRQNIKKLAAVLEQKGFVTIIHRTKMTSGRHFCFRRNGWASTLNRLQRFTDRNSPVCFRGTRIRRWSSCLRCL